MPTTLSFVEAAHAPLVARLEARGHDSHHLEGADYFRRLVEAWPRCSLLANDDDHGEATGYILAHPLPPATAPGEDLPALGSFPVPDSPGLAPESPGRRWFIHDLVVAPESQGSGLGKRLVEASLDVARVQGMTEVWIVALEGREAWWEARGFRSRGLRPEEALGYGPALVMSREL